MVKAKLAVLVSVTIFLVLATFCRASSYSQLVQRFSHPPRKARPWVYWVWLGYDTTRAALTRDLDQMKAKGIVGCILYGNQAGSFSWPRKLVLIGKHYRAVKTNEFKGSHVTPLSSKTLPAWSPRWRKLVCFAAGKCHQLGLTLVVADGLANTSGDISQKYDEQKLAWTEVLVRGPLNFNENLPEPRLFSPGNGFPHPKEKPYHRDVAVLAVPNRKGFSADQVINLTSKMTAAGHLRWHVPSGAWRIIRFVQVPTGAHNFWGYYNDSMSRQAMRKQWDVTMAPLLKEMTPTQRLGLKGIEDDSWEAGGIGWTKLFPAEFKKRRGYNLIPYLPIIAGVKMGSAATRKRVLRDYRLTISDLIAANHYRYLRKLAKANGLAFYSEAAGPNYGQADLLKTSGELDHAMAEFWMPCIHRPSFRSRILMRDAANADHIYGHRITMCESFTSLGPEWQESPFTMKPVADLAFCNGCNRNCIHNFSQSPSLTAKPGYVYVAGTHYDPGITWWNETPAFNLYLARCCTLLQAGRFYADALIYRGDNIGQGEQMKFTLPTLGHGFDHDNCNSQVLRTRTSVHHGRIVLTDGMSYRLLVLPNAGPMPFNDLKKIEALVEAGATVVGPPPSGFSGMARLPHQQQQFNSMVRRLWGGLNGLNKNHKRVGAGDVYWGISAREVLNKRGVGPDFQVRGLSSHGTLDWIHRRVGHTDLYFVASRWAYPENVVCTFRVHGKEPELWNPVTGELRDATAFHQHDGCTSIPLHFDPCGAVFVVFHKPIAPTVSGTTTSNYPTLRRLARISGPWTVNFNPKWGGPASTVFPHLIDWTQSANSGIKYYSGTAVYHKTFNIPSDYKKGEHVLLDLGNVNDLAVVRLNGHNLGVVWTEPARVDITSALRQKNNHLVVSIVNLWPNRLIGDAALPKSKRFTHTNIHKFTKFSPLLPSGLVGPVRLLSEQPPRMTAKADF